MSDVPTVTHFILHASVILQGETGGTEGGQFKQEDLGVAHVSINLPRVPCDAVVKRYLDSKKSYTRRIVFQIGTPNYGLP